MSKVVGAMVVTLITGGGAMSLLQGVLGAYAEAVSLGLMGLGLMASSQLFNRPLAQPNSQPALEKAA
jgi:TPP-dependent 2-oxoacid decarboxylase